jgi:serine/threonine-protein kinase
VPSAADRHARDPAGPAAVTRFGDDLPELLPDYQVLYLLETGSVARVYVARESGLPRLVAIKVLAPHLARDERATIRFEREVQAAAQIQHPNVAAVYRHGRLAGGLPYYVMPFFDGGTLEHRLRGGGALPVTEARWTIRQIADALAAAHRLRIVHRDVRPANILYDRATQRVLLADFGIASVVDVATIGHRITLPGEQLGHPSYTSPEQLQGEPVTERADVFSLGVVAFEILTGELPFPANNVAAAITARMSGQPRRVQELRPDVPADLDELVSRCLARRYEHRPFAADVAASVG